MSIGVRGKFIIGFDGHEHRIIRDGVVIVEGNRVIHVGKSYSGSVDRWINAQTSLVMPGLINTHIHAATAPKDKGFIDDTGARHFYMSSLGENLTALGQAMRPDGYVTFSKFSLAECLRSGTTTLLDIGMVNTIGEENTASVVGELGIRAYEGPGIADGVWDRGQAADLRTRWKKVLYVSGEESERQIKMRAVRLGGKKDLPKNLLLVTETNLEVILNHIREVKPELLIVDSIQTTYLSELDSSAGSVSQVRECSSQLRELAKTSSISVFVIGHVTKEGAIAGPRVLEHVVDTVLYLEGDRFQAYRVALGKESFRCDCRGGRL